MCIRDSGIPIRIPPYNCSFPNNYKGILNFVNPLQQHGAQSKYGGGAQIALSDAGIRLYGGVSGSADVAAEALVDVYKRQVLR